MTTLVTLATSVIQRFGSGHVELPNKPLQTLAFAAERQVVGQTMGFWRSIVGGLLRRSRPTCSHCGGNLKTRNWIRATCVDAQGERYPDSWTYESCDRCGGRSKRYLDGRVEVPSDEEWRIRDSRATSPTTHSCSCAPTAAAEADSDCSCAQDLML